MLVLTALYGNAGVRQLPQTATMVIVKVRKDYVPDVFEAHSQLC
jgi:hypothetical protein